MNEQLRWSHIADGFKYIMCIALTYYFCSLLRNLHKSFKVLSWQIFQSIFHRKSSLAPQDADVFMVLSAFVKERGATEEQLKPRTKSSQPGH